MFRIPVPVPDSRRITKPPKPIRIVEGFDWFQVSVPIPDYFEVGTIPEHATKMSYRSVDLNLLKS
jgi:hypothetical protein